MKSFYLLKRKLQLMPAAIILIALAMTTPICAQTITTIDEPGAGTGPGQGTNTLDITNALRRVALQSSARHTVAFKARSDLGPIAHPSGFPKTLPGKTIVMQETSLSRSAHFTVRHENSLGTTLPIKSTRKWAIMFATKSRRHR